MRLYQDRRDLNYQQCPSIDLIDDETRRCFTSPYPSSLIIVNAASIQPLNNNLSNVKSPYLFENLDGTLLESSLNPRTSNEISISSPVSTNSSKRHSRSNRSFQTKIPHRRQTRIKKQLTVGTGEHASSIVLVENEVVFQQLLKECTTKVIQQYLFYK